MTRGRTVPTGNGSAPTPPDRHVNRYKSAWSTLHTVGELIPCGCDAATKPGLVLDPFFGSGTVGVVAESLKRDWLGIELNPEYADLAVRRLQAARSKRAATVDRQERAAA